MPAPHSPGFAQSLATLQQSKNVHSLAGVQRGIEKESLRVRADGEIAKTSHPAGFGSALAHPHITTDFSEALLEFITPVSNSVDEVLGWLREIHQYTYAGLGDEILWASSMPCVLPDDAGIPVAQYGQSNIAQMKTAYRHGLGHRYGRAMQTIAGIHYNFSFSEDFWDDYQNQLGSSLSKQDFKTEQYFHLIRNFRRYSWLLVYLFGASPALCRTFLGHDNHSLQRQGKGTLYAPHGTSLRMGDLGYQSSAQQDLFVSYNGLGEYSETLSKALIQSLPEYEKIGTHRNERRIQLSTSLLQIENEFYSSIRPKRVTQSGEAPLDALNTRGVEYIEVRCLDVNPYLPLGIDEHEVRFIDAFLLYCLLEDSPPLGKEECTRVRQDNKMMVNNGRANDASVHLNDEKVPVSKAANTLLERLEPCAALFDTAKSSTQFSAALDVQCRKLDGRSLLPSAQVLSDLDQYDNSYFSFAMQQSRAKVDWFAEHPLSRERQDYFDECSRVSLARQAEIEAADDCDFEQFLTDYYARSRHQEHG